MRGREKNIEKCRVKEGGNGEEEKELKLILTLGREIKELTLVLEVCYKTN